MSELTAERLRELLDYDAETGIFTRKSTHGRWKAGSMAGTTNAVHGYVIIGVDGCSYLAHRLAWLYVHGEWPSKQIDHINGKRADNRIENLRDVTQIANLQNSWLKPVGRSGYRGVTITPVGRFAACITANYKPHYLGTFDTPEEAHAAYLEAKRRLHEGCTI